jgi:cytochrome c biogenesis protein
VVRFTDRYGRSQTSVAPFLPQDGMLTSHGVVTFPDANVDPASDAHDSHSQVGFAGFYLPTVPPDPSVGRSAFPAERSPALMLQEYVGDLGLDSGIPQSVYQLNERQVSLGRLVKTGAPYLMRPGDTVRLDDGGQLEFLGTRQWITLAVRHDPGEKPVLVAAVCLLVGLILSLTGRRRRIWFRIGPGGVTAGGLPRSDHQGFAAEFEAIVRAADGAPGAAADSGDRVPATAGAAGPPQEGS